ncbi:unnamed protein product [Parnassius apollo]|uniref:(apollo) hypothetical protein n=1 Tax=Parnassius apollo TaxID=110799 RepID=A0A8S3WSH5_PARAO|nr:unnamed protein product [Parnassius apollo]
MKSKLCCIEIFVCFCVWICANLYSLFKLFEAQTEILQQNGQETNLLKDLKPGWRFIQRHRDESDIEWRPIILYEEFEKSFNIKYESLTLRLKRFISDLILLKFYSLILDIAFHYIYFFAMQDNMELVRKLPTTALCGGGLWMGLEFHMKYVISYGTTTTFARLDNIEPPPMPRCIARVHIYSQMWRHFDVGLYRFLVKYIYKPGLTIVSTLTKLPKIVHRLTASLATFVFIFMWHGTVWHIFIWSTLNYLGITLEHVGKELSRHSEMLNNLNEQVLLSKLDMLCV